MKKNFDQKIDEMLVVLNAIKKKPKEEEQDQGCVGEDPVTCAMNDALKSLGFSVVDKDSVEQPPPEDGLGGIEGRIEDLDLPRPADNGSEDDGEDSDDDGDSNPFDPLGDGVVDMDNGDSDDEGKTGEDNGGVEDENDADELKIKRLDNGDVVFSFEGKDVTVTKDNLGQIVEFLSGSESDDGDYEGFGSEDDSDNDFGDNSDDSEETDDSDDSDDDEEDA